jgi:F-type H+-transporting ATPase subunit a
MAPMNILEEVTNLVSLALRLYGNIYAGEVLVSLLLQLSQQNAFAYPIAFVLNIVWTGFLCIYFMLTELCICYVGIYVSE